MRRSTEGVTAWPRTKKDTSSAWILASGQLDRGRRRAPDRRVCLRCPLWVLQTRPSAVAKRGEEWALHDGEFPEMAAMTSTRKILIVDDDAELRDGLVEQLALHEEFESIAVDTGSKGVQAAKAGQVDLVIMDVGLPDVD